jgi:proteasome lid subunit RPN8/RPN11
MRAAVRAGSMPSIAADSLIIGRGVLSDISAHAREEAPNECCGLLLGKLPRIEAGVRARNLRAWRSRGVLAAVRRLRRAVGLRPSPLRYLIDPRDQFAALKLARSLGMSVVGAYHSHPEAAPVPSRTDLAEALDPMLVHVIVAPETSRDAAEIRAWRLEQGRAHELRVLMAE